MSTQFTIEKNIPIPQARHKNSLELVETLKSMEIGDSFAYMDDTASKSGMVRFRAAAKEADIKITIRATEGNQYRVWRTA